MNDVPPANPPPEAGWRKASAGQSLPESHGSVAIPTGAGFWRKLLAFSGPGYLVAVGYMDPGNWATDLAGGSSFGYTLLSVIMLSNLMAILLQMLCLKLGIVTGRDLAQACRDHYSKPVAVVLWLMCEVAICACDLAEVIGTAIALNLLFHIPLVWGVCLTALDVLVVLWLAHHGFRWLEALVVSLVLLIGVCFGLEILFARPGMREVLGGFLPSREILTNPEMLYIAIGIIGATVMPHNLYLHSSLVQSRSVCGNGESKREAACFLTLDAVAALTVALFVNAAILITAAAAFNRTGNSNVADLETAYFLLAPLLGSSTAPILFAVALLAAGQNSTLTGVMAGQVVMEGFLSWRISPTLRRFVTRLITLVPVLAVTLSLGSSGINSLLVLSQVILSFQLPFALVPLMQFTGDAHKMGAVLVNSWSAHLIGWGIVIFITSLNVYLIITTAMQGGI